MKDELCDILTITDIVEYQYSRVTFQIRTRNRNQIKNFCNYLCVTTKFKFVYLECSTNEYRKRDSYMVFKDCFVTSVSNDNGDFVVSFDYGELLKNNENKNILRKIKFNKLMEKIKST